MAQKQKPGKLTPQPVRPVETIKGAAVYIYNVISMDNSIGLTFDPKEADDWFKHAGTPKKIEKRVDTLSWEQRAKYLEAAA